MKMPEAFIYYLWSFKLFRGELKTTDGDSIKIINTGVRNQDSGPDFFNARVKIGVTEWAGNVEMHVFSSDWLRHNHQHDKAYDSVILHVVYEADMEIENSFGEKIPSFAIKGFYPEEIYFRYRNLIGSRDWVPCHAHIPSFSDMLVYSCLDRVLVERLERKTAYLEKVLEENQHHWEEAFYLFLARSFGFKTNAEPFEQLARILPTSILNKHKDNLFQIEALLYGQAGLLNPNLKDSYNLELLEEYRFLSKKYQLKAAKSWTWKFMRMRPVNFPTIRIAQFAQLIVKSGHLLSRILEIEKLSDFSALFDVGVSAYWLTHYAFGKPSRKSEKSLGSSSFDLILINTLVPFLFVYGKRFGRDDLVERVLLMLQQTKAEDNGVVRRWNQSGIKALHAGHSQALLTLKDEYCTHVRCLDCVLGNSILRNKKE